MERKFKTGLIIGRFQPFHNGHLYLIKEALKRVDRLVIGIGSSNIKNEENWLTLPKRKKMIETVFEKEEWGDRLLKIVAIPDVFNDDKWLKITKKRVGEFDVSIGNNEWVNKIFEKAAIPILKASYYKRKLYEGVKIRKLLVRGENVEKRIPTYLIKYFRPFGRRIRGSLKHPV